MPVYIKRGHRGSYVYDIQQKLNQLAVGDYSGTGLYLGSYSSLPLLAEDGIFGKGTKARVEEIQTFHGLQVDGIVGPMTWSRLMGDTMPMPVIVEVREKDGKDHAGSGKKTKGVLYVHSHDVPDMGKDFDFDEGKKTVHVVVPNWGLHRADDEINAAIAENDLLITRLVLNSHGGGAGLVSFGGESILLGNHLGFFGGAPKHMAPDAKVRIYACAFAVASVPWNSPDAWMVAPMEMRDGRGIEGLRKVARHFQRTTEAGFGIQYSPRGGFTGPWVSVSPSGECTYYLHGRILSAKTHFDAAASFIDACMRYGVNKVLDAGRAAIPAFESGASPALR